MSKRLPTGLSVAAPPRAAKGVRFLADCTWLDGDGRRHSEQAIFDEVFHLIRRARRLVVLDMFLFNDFAGTGTDTHRPLTDQLTQLLIDCRSENPELRVVLITDPFNLFYGGIRNPHLERLGTAGVHVVITDLTRLRDPNPLWSALWRWSWRHLGNSIRGGWLPSPVGTAPVTLRSWLALLNFKANHRKTLVVDDGDDWTGLVTSGNPHNASSAHGNVALRFRGTAALDLLRTEQAVAAFSGAPLELPEPQPPVGEAGAARIRILTEAAIRDAVLDCLDASGSGDRIDLLMFYLSHRRIVRALLATHRRGAVVRLLLDPNKDAFGRKKNGVPNRQVAGELHRAGIAVRWMDTHGEQSHGKLLLCRGPADASLILGSANFTRRNLDDYNLETDVCLEAPTDHPAIAEADTFFQRQWHNLDGRHFSVPMAHYADPSRRRYLLYRLMESTGLSTF